MRARLGRWMRTAAITATLYVFAYLVFINWAGAVQLEMSLILAVLVMASGPVAVGLAARLWWLVANAPAHTTKAAPDGERWTPIDWRFGQQVTEQTVADQIFAEPHRLG